MANLAMNLQVDLLFRDFQHLEHDVAVLQYLYVFMFAHTREGTQ
ncbi:hypothetical protein T05_4199 [Trichinella murrelli]|uniref:Uncharacterized protein n=1 Tax=Trichinella murrelli TaxID=144512 RepID=A0A0V0SVB6_9BILA|nr:hypothetical protein T05_4199 [Trichinella murrelli]